MERFLCTATLTCLLLVGLLNLRITLAFPAEEDPEDSSTPVVLKPREYHTVFVGDTLRLPCNIRGQGGVAVAWYQGDVQNGKTLFLDDAPMPHEEPNENYQTDAKDHSLTILHVNANSTGTFTCAYDPKTYAEHVVRLGRVILTKNEAGKNYTGVGMLLTILATLLLCR